MAESKRLRKKNKLFKKELEVASYAIVKMGYAVKLERN
jgi:hypothetical protein